MAKTKDDIILVQIDDEIVELKGEDKELFVSDKKQLQEQAELFEQQKQEYKELKISAYKKLGLTDEEINAII